MIYDLLPPDVDHPPDRTGLHIIMFDAARGEQERNVTFQFIHLAQIMLLQKSSGVLCISRIYLLHYLNLRNIHSLKTESKKSFCLIN